MIVVILDPRRRPRRPRPSPPRRAAGRRARRAAPRPGVEAARAAGEAAGRRPRAGAARAAHRPRGGDGTRADARAASCSSPAASRSPCWRRSCAGRTGVVRLDRSVAEWAHAHATPFSEHAPEGVHRPRVAGRGRRAGGTARRRRDRTDAQPLGRPVPRRGRRRQRCAHDHGQAPGRPRAADARPDRGDARAVVPERPLVVRPRRSSRPPRSSSAGSAAAARAPASPGRPPGWRSAIAASRVLLDVHWLSDVLAGLALGWAWFAACASRSAGACCASALPPRSRSTRRPRHHATGPRRAAAPRPAEGPARGGDRRRDPSSRPRASRPLSCSAASG